MHAWVADEQRSTVRHEHQTDFGDVRAPGSSSRVRKGSCRRFARQPRDELRAGRCCPDSSSMPRRRRTPLMGYSTPDFCRWRGSLHLNPRRGNNTQEARRLRSPKSVEPASLAVRAKKSTSDLSTRTNTINSAFCSAGILVVFVTTFSERSRTPRCPIGYGVARLNRMIDLGSVGEDIDIEHPARSVENHSHDPAMTESSNWQTTETGASGCSDVSGLAPAPSTCQD